MIGKGGGQFSEKALLHQHDPVPVDAIRGDDVPRAEKERQRVDRWLWHARLVRTRSAAAALASSGHVRINGARIRAPGRMVRNGDVITVALDCGVRVLKVTGFSERRGPAKADRALYEELA
jgi:ribosome-associated heat shock protein Hsp15